jgi:ribonuclease HI
MEELFCDGGLIGRNPSREGGTWAWRLVIDGVAVRSDSGILRPSDIGTEMITNNNTELYAILRAIDEVPTGWRGRLSSDSRVALGWVFKRYDSRRVPDVLLRMLLAIRDTAVTKNIVPRLLQGHPTREDLDCGIGARRDLPVSVHQEWCDRECGRMAARP